MTEIETGEEIPTVEEEFRDLSQGAQEVINKLSVIALRLEEQKSAPVTRKELVDVLRILSGDLATVLKDTINACGGALDELFTTLASEGEDEAEAEDDEAEDGDDEEDSGAIDEETVEVYITTKATTEALNQWAKDPKSAKVEQFTELAKLNQGVVDMLEENFGDALREQAALKIQAVQQAAKSEQQDA